MKTGAQLYTIKSYTQNVKDFACSMKKIAEMGYKTVQISAVGKDLKPEQIREIRDANGLEIALTHSDPNRILYDTEALIKEHDIMGCRYIGLGMMPERYRTKGVAEPFSWMIFKEPQKRLLHQESFLMYHNHNTEF